MAPVAFIPPALSRRAAGPVPMWPYALASSAWLICVVGVAVLTKQRWGIAAPLAFGLVGAWISIPFSAWLFFRTHRRRLLPIERGRFTIGCFVVLWAFDELPIIVQTAREGAAHLSILVVLTALTATLIDLILVWVIVRCVDFVSTKRYA
jgi:membrane protease YdiL (CAAX protease family)